MCKIEKKERKGVMGFKVLGGGGADKFKNSMLVTTTSSPSRSKMKLWMIRATTSVLLWTCIVQLTALGDMWGPRVLKGWPACFSQESAAASSVLQDKLPSVPARALPPKSEFLFSNLPGNWWYFSVISMWVLVIILLITPRAVVLLLDVNFMGRFNWNYARPVVFQIF